MTSEPQVFSEVIAALVEAFTEPLWPGVWDKQAEPHEHDPPFCWGRPTSDCTLRVVTMIRSEMALREIARVGQMTPLALRERLAARGITRFDAKVLTQAQVDALQQARDWGLTLNALRHEVEVNCGRTLSATKLSQVTKKANVGQHVTMTMRAPVGVPLCIEREAKKRHMKPGLALWRMLKEAGYDVG